MSDPQGQPATLLAVCRGGARPLRYPNGVVEHTGIVKEPLDGPVVVGRLGIEGDVQVNTRHHGGVDQAVYVYAQSDRDHFVDLLGVDLPHGAFGENLVVSAWGTQRLCIGDRLHVGDEVVLEVTSPRIPCATFGQRMRDAGWCEKGWVKTFTAARRPGAYTRVLATGSVRPGDPVRHEPGRAQYPLLEMWDLCLTRDPDGEAIARALAAPIDERSRADWTPSAARA